MSYRLHVQDGLEASASTLALELAEGSLARLERAEVDSKDVHEVRKNCKKLRGLARLLRPALGKKAYRRSNVAFRDAARELSAYRDDHAVLETFDALVALTGAGEPALASVRAALEARAQATAANLASGSAPLARAREQLRGGKRCVAQWQLDDDGADALEKGLRRTYARGRRGLGRAAARPNDESLHEWRKRAKYTWYHLKLLKDAAPSVLSPLAKRFHDLADCLGDDHDLAVLLHRVRDDPAEVGGDRAVEAVSALVHPVRADLQDRGFRLGFRLYQEPAKAFARRVAGYWTVWEEHGRERRVGELGDLGSSTDDLDELPLAELYARAQALNIPGRSAMRRLELAAALRAAGETASSSRE